MHLLPSAGDHKDGWAIAEGMEPREDTTLDQLVLEMSRHAHTCRAHSGEGELPCLQEGVC